MGDVHLAKLSGELGFEKLVVVKTIRAELASDPRFVELFASEAKTAVSLSHPNITPIYELGRADDGTLYTAMGWVDGPSLAQWIERRRNQGSEGFEIGAALAIVRELLDALAHAHSREQGRTPVVHRDVTPRNVLVERSGRVQLVDFGIAKPAGTGGGVQGSAGYMAPEQARGEPVDPRADLFSVGTLLYELLTLEQAFPHEGIWSLPDMRAIHPRLRPLLERALALDPAERFTDARAFLREVAALQAAGERFPEMDLSRVGVFGWSFGGYMAALAVLRRPDVFHVGVAGAPVVDWRDYDTCYTERYISTPKENPDGYDRSSLLTYAPQLRRPLLLIHGTADDNVLFFHSLKLSQALFRAGKPHELLPLPGLTHMVPDPVITERMWGRIVGAFAAVLHPELEHLAVKPGSGAPPLPEPIPAAPAGNVPKKPLPRR